MVEVKLCGITREEDLTKLIELNVSWAGFIFYKKSVRNVDYNNKRLIGFEKNIKLQWSTEDINKNGIIGNPANADSKKGKELTNIITSTLKKIITELKLL